MKRVVLAGNPNVGKSTLFNALTGGRQHTGNWPGKTVAMAEGSYTYKGSTYALIDLPGTYSLISRSPEEAVAEEFLRSEEVDCAIVVCDCTCLERSLILPLQIMTICPRVLICLNLLDEAQRAGIQPDPKRLSTELGIPVVTTCAPDRIGTDRLLETVRAICDGFMPPHIPSGMLHGNTEQESDEIARSFAKRAEKLADIAVMGRTNTKPPSFTQRLDRVVLHRVWGFGIMGLLLLGVLWLTIIGANYPSQGLQWLFDRLGQLLGRLMTNAPPWFSGLLLDGIYATVTRVIAVMLPPMAIFFPLFTLLEDFGYLPRMAFLLDEPFRRCGVCGKQALTMCMGFGCNAAGVTGCRIISSPRERIIAIVTNTFVPCNGRFPALILLISIGFGTTSGFLQAAILLTFLLLSVYMTLIASRLLHKCTARDESYPFILELPPYRRPRILPVLLRSVKERTLLILGRAILAAAPAGLLLWLLANLSPNGQPLLQSISAVLDTPAGWLGLNGSILLAFFLGSPANELVLPILIMILTAASGFGQESAIGEILLQHGWSFRLSLCTMLFFLFHWPCLTTLITIYRETRSFRWTLISALLPTAFGVVLCLLVALLLP